MSLVDREVVRLRVGRCNSGGVPHALLACAMLLLVFEEVTDIFVREFTIETLLHVLDLAGDDWIVVVSGRLIDELLVQDTLKQQVEVRHETSIVAVLVLGEDRIKSVVDLLVGRIGRLNRREAEQELRRRAEGQAINPARDSRLIE